MHILHVFDHSIPLHSGYTFRSRAIIEAQRARGWTTAHITGPKQGLVDNEIESADGLTFYRTPVPQGLRARVPLLNHVAVIEALAARLENVVASEKPDVVHAHSPALNGIAALRICTRHSIPLVYECRAFWEDAAVDHGTSRCGGARYRLTRAMESHVFRRAHAITTICEGLRDEIISRGIAKRKVTIIPNAVDISRFTYPVTPDRALAEQLRLTDEPVLGFIGSFYAYEGLDLLVAALAMIREQCHGTKLLLVGGGNEASKLERQIHELGLRDAVITPGRVAHEQVAAYYSLVDVLVYPRRAMRLTELVTPLKPLEAMAQGKLVAASNVGGHRELIEHERTGYLFEAGSSTALAQCVIDMLGARERWQGVREAARAYVEQQRNWAGSVARYEGVYELAGVKPATAPTLQGS